MASIVATIPWPGVWRTAFKSNESGQKKPPFAIDHQPNASRRTVAAISVARRILHARTR